MSTATTHQQHCSKCKEKTDHVPIHQGFMQVAIKTLRIIVFFVSFGMVYPHTFSDDDDIAVTCTKCGMQAKMSH